MTAQPRPGDFAVDATTVLALARSAWLDAFSRVEVAVHRCAGRHRLSLPRGAPLAERIKKLAAVKASAHCSRADAAKLAEVVGRVEELLPLRATIVHSAMEVGQYGGTCVAMFRNAVDAAFDVPSFMVLSAQDLVRTRGELEKIAARLDSVR